MSETSGLLGEFCLEADELLETAGAALLRLEEDPTSEELLRELLRHFHTVKGASGLFDLAPLTSLVHTCEDLLVAVRDGGVPATSALVDDLLAATDRLREWIAAVQATGSLDVEEPDAVDLERRLRRWTGRPGAGPALGAASVDQARAWLTAIDRDRLAESAQWLRRTGATVRVVGFEPPDDAFYLGEDPVAVLQVLPGIDLAGCIVAPGAAEGLTCSLRLVATTRAAPAEIATAFAGVRGTVAVAELTGAELTAGSAADPGGIARRLLSAQLALLGRPMPEEQREGRLRAAAASAAGALRALLPDLDAGDLAARMAAATAAAVTAGDPALLRDELVALEELVDSGPGVEVSPPAPAGPTVTAAPVPATAAPQPHLRVDRPTLDRLLRYAGELTIEMNALPYLAARAQQEGAAGLATELLARASTSRRLSEDLQALVMGMRMLPVAAVFDRFPRLVRDHARDAGKQIRFERVGGETTADADVIDLLGDALLHLVRNALDHGIETVAERREAGKPEEATLTVRAELDTDGLVVEVADDGRGVDPAALRRRAHEMGVLDEAHDGEGAVERGDDLGLAFLPGLSTAPEVTSLSGRGVGLDAVRAALAASKGSVTMTSTPGAGTTVRLRVPRSINIQVALVVRTSGHRFAVPLDDITRTLRVPVADRQRLGQVEVLDYQGETVPIRPLRQLLRLVDDDTGDLPAEDLVLVTRTDGGLVGLGVESVDGREEVLVKPLDGLLGTRRSFLGTALRTDGSLLLVLDTRGVARAG